MHRDLNAHQKRCSEAIVAHINEYLDRRALVTTRANPRMRDLWPNLQWTILTQLRKTIENDKMWGPNRYVLAEVFCSDDRQKIRDLFNPTNQVSIQTEVVEKRDTAGHKTADVLEIHDFRTLYGAIEPSVASAASVMQIYIWWDLPDACDLARTDLRAERLRKLASEGATSEEVARYCQLMQRAESDPPDAEAIAAYELKLMHKDLERMAMRRAEEPGYQVIPAARPRAENAEADSLIGEVARELAVMKTLTSGEPIDGKLRAQFARALHVAEDAVTNDMAADLLSRKLMDNKSKLRELLSQECDGDFYNFKQAQLQEAERMFQSLLGGRDLSQLPEVAAT